MRILIYRLRVYHGAAKLIPSAGGAGVRENLNLRFVFVPQIERRAVRLADVSKLFRIKLQLRYKIHTFGTLASRDRSGSDKNRGACNGIAGMIKFHDQGLALSSLN